MPVRLEETRSHAQKLVRRTGAIASSFLALLLFGCATVAPEAQRRDLPPIGASPAWMAYTPVGAINADVNQANIHQTICVPGWTASVRPSTSYTNGVKLKLLAERGLPASDAGRFELDHFVPLVLGGHPRSPDNLWLQPWDGEWGAQSKDLLEVRLKTLVCQGQLTLQRARDGIRSDWIAAFEEYVGVREPTARDLEPID